MNNNVLLSCLLCNSFSTINAKHFSNHINSFHNMKSIDYIIKFTHNGQRPLCPICSKETRYSALKFKTYCVEHSSIAESEAGKIGGKAQAWNKGLTKETDTRLKKQSEDVSGGKNHFYGKHHTQVTTSNIVSNKLIDEQTFNQRIAKRSEDFEVITSYKDYFSRQEQYLEVICKRCKSTLRKTLQLIERDSVCEKCFPNNASKAEREIVKFLEDKLGIKDIECNTKRIINPKELDIYIPSKQFAIEYNGLYWHIDNDDKTKMKDKTLLCKKLGIQLIHIFSDEWILKTELCKSMIKHKLRKSKNRIYARQCSIEEIDSKKARDFFEETHISGNTKCKKAFGLFFKDKLVACMSIRKPRQKTYKDATIEIARFSSALDTSVVGGFSKLLNAIIIWSKQNSCSNIISYADLRFSDGNVYSRNGFTFIKETGLNYWYTDCKQRFNRFKFRAQNGLTEQEIAQQNKVSKIYGCGNHLYKLEII